MGRVLCCNLTGSGFGMNWVKDLFFGKGNYDRQDEMMDRTGIGWPEKHPQWESKPSDLPELRPGEFHAIILLSDMRTVDEMRWMREVGVGVFHYSSSKMGYRARKLYVQIPDDEWLNCHKIKRAEWRDRTMETWSLALGPDGKPMFF